MPLISYFPSAAGGASIDYNSRPKIDFDGKWLKWFVEFYDGEPYWEAWFLSSGTLTVNGNYIADMWAIGGGSLPNFRNSPYFAGNGHTQTVSGISLSTGQIPVTVGGGAARANNGGGTSSIGQFISAAGGSPGVETTDVKYRFAAPDKAHEAGANSTRSPDSMYQIGRGGWLFWRSDAEYAGEGYGAGGGIYNGITVKENGHSGAAIIRIKI